MAFCGNCGTKIGDSAKFCPHCGAAVEGAPQTSKAPSAPTSASTSASAFAPYVAAAAAVAKEAWNKLLPLLRRHYKVIGIAVLALLFLTQISRCVGGGGGNKDELLDQIRGSWAMQTQVYSDAAARVNRPWKIEISKYSIQLEGRAACPISEAEQKDNALYFPAQWKDSDPGDGREPGPQDYNLRLVYSDKDDLLILDVEVSSEWYTLGEYARKE